MKRIFSMILAMLMIFSSVSFAAPTPVASVETANETVFDAAELTEASNGATVSEEE